MCEHAIRPLRQWRLEAGYGLRELARLAGSNHVTLRNLELGRSAGYPATWRKIAHALGIAVTQIAEYRRAVGMDEGEPQTR